MTGRLARHVGWTVIDHGAFTSAGFVFTLLLAVLLDRTDYGLFTVSNAALVLLGGLHATAVAEPLLVIGPLHFEHELDEYLRTAFAGNALVSIAAAALLALVGVGLWLAGYADLGMAFGERGGFSGERPKSLSKPKGLHSTRNTCQSSCIRPARIVRKVELDCNPARIHYTCSPVVLTGNKKLPP